MSLELTILGLLDLAPMTGYDLKKTFDSSVAHFWAADQAQIYRTLTKLVDSGAVEVEIEPQAGKPDRHVHRITPHGRALLSRWLVSPLDEERTRDPFLARIFFSGREDPSVALGILAQRREQTAGRLSALRSLSAPSDTPDQRTRALTLQYGIRALEAELSWLDEAERALRSAPWARGS